LLLLFLVVPVFSDTADTRADEIIKEIILPEYNDFERALAIHDYIVLHSKYDWDSFISGTIPPESYTAYGILNLGVGVCAGYAEAVKLLLDKAGVENIIISGRAEGPNGWDNHAWNLVKIKGDWYHMDTTWDDMMVKPNEREEARYNIFLIDDYSISLIGNREWNRESYPKADSQKFSYMHAIKVDGGVSKNAYFKYGNWIEFYKLEKVEYNGKYVDGGKVSCDKIWRIELTSNYNVSKFLQSVMVISVRWGVYDYYAWERIPVKVELLEDKKTVIISPLEGGYQLGFYWLFISRYGFVDTESNKPIKMGFEVVK